MYSLSNVVVWAVHLMVKYDQIHSRVYVEDHHLFNYHIGATTIIKVEYE